MIALRGARCFASVSPAGGTQSSTLASVPRAYGAVSSWGAGVRSGMPARGGRRKSAGSSAIGRQGLSAMLGAPHRHDRRR